MTAVGAPSTLGSGASRPGLPGRISPPWTRPRIMLLGGVAAVVVLFVVAWIEIGMGVVPLFTGIGNIVKFVGKTVPPQFSGFASFQHTMTLALETVCMAVIGTAIAVVVSIPVGFLAARNTTPHPALRWLARGIIIVCRSVPDLIFAIVFVEALGIGILPGVLALGFHSVGMLGKLFAEAIEQVPEPPREALTSTGAGRLQNLTTSVIPQVLPSFSSLSLYRLDINLRSSVVLGYVGAGGIGFALNAAMGELLFKEAIAIVLVIFALIVIMEAVAAIVRRSLIGTDNPITGGYAGAPPRSIGDRLLSRIAPKKAPAGDQPTFDRATVRPPWTRERVQGRIFIFGGLLVLALSFWDTGVDPISIVTSFAKIGHTLAAYFPPNFESARSNLLTGTLQSAAVALVATVAGVVFAIPIGLAAARNVSDRWIYRAARTFLLIVRAVPELILAIIFVVAVGLGLVAGAFALMVGTVGFMSKLVADGVEEVPPGPREAVLSAGATRGQETVTSVVGPSVPLLVGNSLYLMDVNFRSSTILGLVGAGGIGYLLQQSVQVLAYRTTGAIIVATFVVVLAIEIITNWVRRQVI
ncbi:MAG TPA: phosphonate ABC transporter, permease protein PhnE [Acidimicrobiales bacterium]|nr:phosphonate ABC transporter, permease protein PhnE [Acidimicrobiales bacterium]